MLQRIAGGGGVLLVETGRKDSLGAVKRKDVDASDEGAATFPTAEEAVAIIFQIGLEVTRKAIGMRRLELKHKERLQSRTKDVSKSVGEGLKGAA
jgi:hypothetical protein